jgi:hypothetical protein
MSNAKVVPISCLGVVIIKHSLIPVSPACNWGQRPVLESACHSWGFDSDALKGILWDSAVMNSEGLEISTGPRR